MNKVQNNRYYKRKQKQQQLMIQMCVVLHNTMKRKKVYIEQDYLSICFSHDFHFLYQLINILVFF